MSGKKPENAKYNEFNTTRTDGTEVDLSARVTGIMSEDTANAVDVTAYFNWLDTKGIHKGSRRHCIYKGSVCCG